VLESLPELLQVQKFRLPVRAFGPWLRVELRMCSLVYAFP